MSERRFSSFDHQPINSNFSLLNETRGAISCQISSVDPKIQKEIRRRLVEEKVNLLEYRFIFRNHSLNPLLSISRYAYTLDSWSRVSSKHGQTLLSLAFNYGIFSLMTLTFGTDVLAVELEESSHGCVLQMEEDEVVKILLNLLATDFRDDDVIILNGDERICHEIIADVDGFAKFQDRCYMKRETEKEGDRMEVDLVEVETGNFWIHFLYTMLFVVRFGIIFFGPLLFTSAVATMSRKCIPYAVELKEPLKKKIFIAENEDDARNVDCDRTIDLRKVKGFPKFRKSIETELIPKGKAFQAVVKQYDILVSYKRLLTENRVPVGLWRSLGRTLFHCKLRNIGPFKACCQVNMFTRCPCKESKRTTWLFLWRKIGLGLMVLCLPFPYYVRLWIFYFYEYNELIVRKEATAKLGLKESLDNSLIHYFTPTHWIFKCVYFLYFISALLLAYMARKSEEGRFRKIITGSFADLENLSWIKVLGMLVGNIIWPFQKFGILGFLVGFVYFPIALPLTLIVYILYSLPLTYLTIRMFFYSKRIFVEKVKTRQTSRTYRTTIHSDDTLQMFEAEFIFNGCCPKTSEDAAMMKKHEDAAAVEAEELDQLKMKKMTTRQSSHDRVSTTSSIIHKLPFNARRFFEHILASSLCVLSLFSVLIILSECVGCLVEIIVFTLMGIIVNAGTLLKYVSLVILIVVYSYDSFNNVEKKYLKLNKALFNEVKGRIKGLDSVTSLPSHLQENRGFKSQELNEQGEHEVPDDVTKKSTRHWMINDLVLFVDNEDMPRIPRKLFDEVCEIRVAGVPGPIYLGLLFGLRQFLKIFLFIFFVFIVVLSFGDVYKISSTNQMLATLAGGFLPVILRQFMEPERPDIEIGTVSFKSKMDEIIKNFKQIWPMYDLPLEVEPPPTINDEPEEEKSEEKKEKEENTSSEEYGGYRKQNETGNAIVGRHVTINEEAKEEGQKVDILIFLQQMESEVWLDQWSDLLEDVRIDSVVQEELKASEASVHLLQQ